LLTYLKGERRVASLGDRKAHGRLLGFHARRGRRNEGNDGEQSESTPH
jgi:hypothetical protein